MIRDRETLNQLLALIDRFVSERLIPRESELAESGSLPEDILDEMKAMGLFGLTIPAVSYTHLTLPTILRV